MTRLVKVQIPIEKLVFHGKYKNNSVYENSVYRTINTGKSWVKFPTISDANKFGGEFIRTTSRTPQLKTYLSTDEGFPDTIYSKWKVLPQDAILTFIGVDEWCLFEQIEFAPNKNQQVNHIDGVSVYKFLYDGSVYCWCRPFCKEYLTLMFSKYYTKIDDSTIELTYVPDSQLMIWKNYETSEPLNRIGMAWSKPPYSSQLASFWHFIDTQGFRAKFSCGNTFL